MYVTCSISYITSFPWDIVDSAFLCSSMWSSSLAARLSANRYKGKSKSECLSQYDSFFPVNVLDFPFPCIHSKEPYFTARDARLAA
jgi:hypothetical protein